MAVLLALKGALPVESWRTLAVVEYTLDSARVYIIEEPPRTVLDPYMVERFTTTRQQAADFYTELTGVHHQSCEQDDRKVARTDRRARPATVPPE